MQSGSRGGKFELKLGEKNLYERQFDEAPNQGHPEKNPNRLLNLNV
jgi:hypothetical protein